jgi:uncharacterized protein (DUF1684 family)
MSDPEGSDGGTDDDADAEAAAEYERWLDEIKQMRADKDEFFTEHPQSPIQPEVRDDFEGLSYFDPKPEFRVPTRVRVYGNPDPIELDVTAGQPIRYLRPYIFEFELRDDRHQLAGYQQEGEDTDTIFIPFRDKTTGQQTYDRGRYMETEPDKKLTNGDTVTLDFNLAYNPFCAYSETFACPLPPEENWLDIVVPAGERKPPEAIAE